MRRLLIIEDNAAEGDNAARLLGPLLECQVQVAKTMLEGKQLVRDWKPDVILLDPGLPDSTTEQSTTEVIELSRSAPVVMLTGQTGIEAGVLRKRAIRNGARNVCQKDHVALCWQGLGATLLDAYLAAFASRTKSQPIATT